MRAPRVLSCLIIVVFLLAGWFALRPVFVGAMAASQSERSGAAVTARATTRADQEQARRRSTHGPSIEGSRTPSYDTMLAQLAAQTTPEAQARAEKARLAYDRETHRQLSAKPEPSDIDLSVMRAIEEQSPYPANNQRFATSEHDPVLARREVEQRNTKSPDGSMHLTVSTDLAQYEPSAIVKLRATLFSNGSEASLAPEPVSSELHATLRRDGEPPLTSFALLATEPGVHLAELDTRSVAGKPLAHGLYFLDVQTREGLAQSVAFVVRPAYGRLTGRYRDYVAQGALVVEAEVQAYADGDYYLLASLYTDSGSVVGMSEGQHALTRGTHWVPIRFHGKLIHDSARPAPYRLAHVQLDKLSFPVLDGEHADPDYWTQKHGTQAFDATPYNPLDAEEDDAL